MVEKQDKARASVGYPKCVGTSANPLAATDPLSVQKVMQDFHNPFISKSFLRSVLALEYGAFKDSRDEHDLEQRLRRWSERTDLKETSAEGALIDVFFRDTWGYVQSGQSGSEDGFTLYPKFPLPGAGAKGGTGEADLAIGYFTSDELARVPQVICEFKDIRSALDAPQRRKGSTRSPVKQCLDYLSAARRGMFGNEPTIPTWAIVTDMNEFRLYWYDRAPLRFLSFTIRPIDLFQGQGLLSTTEEARFDRFLFWALFHKDMLLTTGGRPRLLSLVSQQRFRDRELENTFYNEYRKFRERLYITLLLANPEGTPRFPGTRGRLVRLAQKILDRCIFIFFCEDMGQALAFPPKLLRDFLITRSNDPYFDPEGPSIWQDLLHLFRAMNDGRAFGGRMLNQFNGGLFARDEALELLHVPNSIFCQQGQGQNEATLYTYKETLLYLCASYNYASGWAQGLNKSSIADAPFQASPMGSDSQKNLGLYTLGRIFEQSITELEILEAEADGRRSLNKESKRKRDGVYYTPEWVVERIVTETVGARLDDLKRECDWPDDGLPDKVAIDAFSARLKSFTVLDPACGSGAFLITTLRYLLDAWHELQAIRREVTGDRMVSDDAALIRDILKSNIYGVDINPASVEITCLALWLHTARGDKPLSALDSTIKDGNSLIGSQFYLGQIKLALYDSTEKERINAFDWKGQFRAVFENGGFDAIVGNPPYVKLQNFRRVHSDMAEFLRTDRFGGATYRSTQTGNFDLYLPFIEKGLSLLNEGGRLGYIAPSLWTVNKYGKGLRELITQERALDRWLDFRSFQIFDESTTYTALQFFTKAPRETVKIAFAEDGVVPEDPWADRNCELPYEKLKFGDRWLLLAGKERVLIDRLYESCRRLDDPSITSNIFVGLQTSADEIYHLDRSGPGRYVCRPRGKDAPLPYVVEIEDDLMKPLVSGSDAKRYVEPKPSKYLLFPYRRHGDEVQLLSSATLERQYPKAWAYLLSYEAYLRSRESTKDHGGEIVDALFDDKIWYRFGRNQNIDKQDIQKILVPRLVANLGCSVDIAGEMYLDNVDVGGIQVSEGIDPFFVAALINSPVLNFVFRRISKPFRGKYFSANRQFIAPLPIVVAKSDERAAIARRAQSLQQSHSMRRDLLDRLAKRMETVHLRSKPETWLFPMLRTKRDLEEEAPKHLDANARREWAENRYDQELKARYDTITERLKPGARLTAMFSDGELSFSVDAVPVIDRIFVDESEGAFVVAQWKLIAQSFSVTDGTTGRDLCTRLRRLAVVVNPAVVNQIIELEGELSLLEADIGRQESGLNLVIYGLYGLTDAEIRMVESAVSWTQ